MASEKTYKILAIDEKNHHVTFVLSDGIEQTVCDFPIDNAEALHDAISRYAQIYVSPKEDVQVSDLKSEVSSMIGKTVTVSEAEAQSDNLED